MGKLLFLVLLAVAGWLAWRVAVARARPREPAAPPPLPEPQRIVRCAECDLHLPEQDAIVDDGRHFCCVEHRSEYARRNTSAP